MDWIILLIDILAMLQLAYMIGRYVNDGSKANQMGILLIIIYFTTLTLWIG